MTITIKGISVIKEGTNATGPWKLQKIEDTNGKFHSTFLEGLEIGETYDFIQELKPYKSKKNGKMYQGSNLVGFDNATKETMPGTDPTEDVFTSEDRRKLDAIYDIVCRSDEPQEQPPF